MRSITLTQGLAATVDDEDYAYLSRWQWFAVRGKHTHYAARTVNLSKRQKVRVFMHRQIEGAPDGVHVDHVNGDGLDNRRSNLRLCTNAENARNNVSKRGSSRFKGVGWHAPTSKWSAYVRAEGKQKHLGLFASEEEAARAYDAAAREHYGDFARLNFPEVSHAI